MEEWSSGCESGWTLYFNESSQSQNQSPKTSTKSVYNDHHDQSCNYGANADDEGDLSMVSDASSGPPQFLHHQQDGLYCPSAAAASLARSKRKKAKEPRTKNQHSFLDDTASSSTLNYPNNSYMDQPSINHLFGISQQNGLMGNSAFGDQMGFWQSNHIRQQQQPAEPNLKDRSRGRRRR